MSRRIDLMRYYLSEDEQPPQDQQQQDPNAQQQEAPPEEQGNEGGDPNAAMNGGDPNAQQQQEVAFLPKDETDPDEKSQIDKEFPIETDNQDPQQDILNFTNYQKLQYYHKFRDMLEFIDSLTSTMNKTKSMVSFDEINDENQHKIINLLSNTLEEVKDQVKFFLKTGIAQVNIDKTRVIFRAQIRKLNLVIDKFEEVMRNVKSNNKK